MGQNTLVRLAETLALLGALGAGTAILNAVALRLVRADEVPSWVQRRIHWWSAHNLLFFVSSVALLAAGLIVPAVSGA